MPSTGGLAVPQEFGFDAVPQADMAEETLGAGGCARSGIAQGNAFARQGHGALDAGIGPAGAP